MAGSAVSDFNPLRCDACGRFVSYADLESGIAYRGLVTPDAEGTAETWETLCPPCLIEDREWQQSRENPQATDYVLDETVDPPRAVEYYQWLREIVGGLTLADLERDSVPVVDIEEAVQ